MPNTELDLDRIHWFGKRKLVGLSTMHNDRLLIVVALFGQVLYLTPEIAREMKRGLKRALNKLEDIAK